MEKPLFCVVTGSLWLMHCECAAEAHGQEQGSSCGPWHCSQTTAGTLARRDGGSRVGGEKCSDSVFVLKKTNMICQQFENRV